MPFMLQTLLESPPNWCGLAGASLCLAATAAQALPFQGGVAATLLTVAGYGVGFGMGCLVFGPPRRRQASGSGSAPVAGDTKLQMLAALAGVRQTVHLNTRKRLPKELRSRVLALCAQIEQLLAQWEASKGSLSFEDGFHARHIAVKYLPEALQTYLSIPRKFASTEPVANGLTARQVFEATLDDLAAKVKSLRDALAHNEAQALVNHSTFLSDKFRGGAEGGPRPRIARD